MRYLLQSLIISFAVIAIATPSFAGDDRDDKMWDRDKKEQGYHSKKDKHGKKERHRKGGMPRCESELAECTINLTETETKLAVCEDALAQCQATEGQAIPATGQTTCWDRDGTEIPCDGTGHDGDIQAGAELSYTDNGLTITDNNTKLEWMKQDDNNMDCDSYPGSLDKDCELSEWDWDDAFPSESDDAFAFVATLNANNHAGHTDWRMPNVKELLSIVNYEYFKPAVSAEFNTGCVAGCTVDACSCTAEDTYTSSTSNPADRERTLDVYFGSGYVFGGLKINTARVRAVRGGL